MGKFLIGRRVIFDIIIPCSETVLDYLFCGETISAGHPMIGAIMLIFNLVVLLYYLCNWIATDRMSKKEKFGFFFFIPFFSPYLHLKVFIDYLKREDEDEWTEKYNEIKQHFGNVDSFLKSIPSMFLKYGVYTVLVTRDSGGANLNHVNSICTMFSSIFKSDACKDMEDRSMLSVMEKQSCTSKVIEVFGESKYWISNQYVFPILLIVSMINGTRNVSSYLINGPFKITSKNKCYNYIYNVLKIVYVLTEYVCKLYLFMQISMLLTKTKGLEAYPGYVPFLTIFGYYFVFPVIFFSFVQTILHLGWKNFINLILHHPALITFPFITDFIVCPSDWCCRRQKRNIWNLKINYGISWLKRIWSFSPIVFAYYVIYEDLHHYRNKEMSKCIDYRSSDCHNIYCDYFAHIGFITFSAISLVLFIFLLHGIGECSHSSIPITIALDQNNESRNDYEMVNTRDLNDQTIHNYTRVQRNDHHYD